MLIRFSRLCPPKQNIFYYVFSNRLSKYNLCSNAVAKNWNVEYFLILDFEATCDRKVKIDQEIIEFPCLKINSRNFLEEGRFHHYVRPLINPTLSNFCVELTGILQEMVDNEKTFPEVFQLFEEWRKKENVTEENSIFVTSGDWDLGHMLPRQCGISGIKLPSYAMEWIDIKKMYGNTTGKYFSSLIDVIKESGLEFQGRQHSGIDDCLNIYYVLKKLSELKSSYRPTSRLIITENKHRVLTV